MGCEGNHAERPERAWFVGASFGAFTSELRFDDESEPSITETSLVASGGYRWGDGWSVRLAAGAVLGGSLELGGSTYDVEPGWLVVAGVSRSFTFSERWFVSGSVTAGVSSASTRADAPGGMDASLTAGDVRLGVIAGVTLWERLSPYVLARAFAGPVMWTLGGEDITGSDQHHYQLGVGASVSLPWWSASVVVDGSLLGERALSIGVSAEL